MTNFVKKETLAEVFSCEFCEISKNIFSYRIPLVAASDIYHLFAITLILIRSRHRKRKKKVEDGVSGFDLYLLIEQLAVLPEIKIFVSFTSSIAWFKATVYILVLFMQNVNMIFICFYNFNFNKKQ